MKWLTDCHYIKHVNKLTLWKAGLDWAESDLWNIRRVGEADSPFTWFYPESSKPITKDWKNVIQICHQEISKSRTSKSTKIESQAYNKGEECSFYSTWKWFTQTKQKCGGVQLTALRSKHICLYFAMEKHFDHSYRGGVCLTILSTAIIIQVWWDEWVCRIGGWYWQGRAGSSTSRTDRHLSRYQFVRHKSHTAPTVKVRCQGCRLHRGPVCAWERSWRH
jgi:hypothetical protein